MAVLACTSKLYRLLPPTVKIDSPLVSARWAHEFQHRYFETLFGQTLFDKAQFGFGQTGFEHVLVVTNISLMVA